MTPRRVELEKAEALMMASDFSFVCDIVLVHGDFYFIFSVLFPYFGNPSLSHCPLSIYHEAHMIGKPASICLVFVASTAVLDLSGMVRIDMMLSSPAESSPLLAPPNQQSAVVTVVPPNDDIPIVSVPSLT
jgi:hypothetical protein